MVTRILRTDAYEQIVYGQVYAPNKPDSHGAIMLPEDVRKMAHRFLRDVVLARSIDVMHDNNAVSAYPVESFIACANHPEGYDEGGWVVGVKIEDPVVWAKVLNGDLNGFSFEAYVTKAAVVAEVSVIPHYIGQTEEEAGHSHLFFVEINADGRVVGGRTAVAAGHYHEILRASATEDALSHSHRFFVS
mgnify:CR=1 FL=1